ncbi:MAG: hypothetical protein ACYC55_02330 [Candidatus Geothermincolia bacterium]
MPPATGPFPPVAAAGVAGRRRRRTASLTGGILAVIGGAAALAAGWLPWVTATQGRVSLEFSGWDFFSEAADLGERFLMVEGSEVLFTWLSTSIVAALLVLAGIALLAMRRRGLGVPALLFGLVLAAMGALSMVALAGEGTSLSYGLFLLTGFGVVGAAGGVVALLG